MFARITSTVQEVKEQNLSHCLLTKVKYNRNVKARAKRLPSEHLLLLKFGFRHSI